MFKFDNTYAKLPENFFENVRPTPVENPALGKINLDLAQELGLDFLGYSDNQLARVFSGNDIIAGSQPIALAYAGHQFGHFVPQLGDGRAILLGEILDRQKRRFDVQLKGSGPTRFSRRGDGRATISSVIREFIVSEAMFRLGIPTTRSLAFVTTGESVQREKPMPGGILTRIASSHIRVGTFEYFAAKNDLVSVKALADYTIDRHYPAARLHKNPYLGLFENVIVAQAQTISHWMSVGFIHGVMNTDNMSISGETIDYGPCAFMDEYNPETVFSSIDRNGRYSFMNQAGIAQWNLTNFGYCLQSLLNENESIAEQMVKAAIDEFAVIFQKKWRIRMLTKIGLSGDSSAGNSLVADLLDLMHQNSADFTLSFRYLTDLIGRDEFSEEILGVHQTQKIQNSSEPLVSEAVFAGWITRWLSQLNLEGRNRKIVHDEMASVNPVFIARNHRVDQVLREAELGNYKLLDQIMHILRTPFHEQREFNDYRRPPQANERIVATFCGT